MAGEPGFILLGDSVRPDGSHPRVYRLANNTSEKDLVVVYLRADGVMVR